MANRLTAAVAWVLAGAAVSWAYPSITPRAIWQSNIACDSSNQYCNFLASSTGKFVAAFAGNINVFGGSLDVSSWPNAPITSLVSSGITGSSSCAWSADDGYISCVAFPQVAIWKSSAFASSGGPTSSLVAFSTTAVRAFADGWSPDGKYLAFGESAASGSGIQIYGGNTDPSRWATSTYRLRLTGLSGAADSLTWISNGTATYLYAAGGSTRAVWGGASDAATWRSTPVKIWNAGNGVRPQGAFYANGYLLAFNPDRTTCSTLAYGNGNTDPTTWVSTPIWQLNGTCRGSLSPNGTFFATYTDYNTYKNMAILYGGSNAMGSWSTQPIATSQQLSIPGLFFGTGVGWGASDSVLFAISSGTVLGAFAVLSVEPSPTPTPLYPAISSAPAWQSTTAGCAVGGGCTPLVSNTGKWLAAVPYQDSITIFGGSTNVTAWPRSPVTTLAIVLGTLRYRECAWSPDDAYIACVSDGRTLLAPTSIWKSSTFATSRGSVSPVNAFFTSCPSGYGYLLSLAWSPDGKYIAVGESSGYQPGGTGVQIFGGNTDPAEWNTTAYRIRLTGLYSDVYAVTWISHGTSTYLYAAAGSRQALWRGGDNPAAWSATPLKTWMAALGSSPQQASYANGYLFVFDYGSFGIMVYGNGAPNASAWSTTPTLQISNTYTGALSPNGDFLAAFSNARTSPFGQFNVITLYGGSSNVNSWSSRPVVSQALANSFNFEAAWSPTGKWIFGAADGTNLITAFAVATPSPSPSAPPAPSSSPSPLLSPLPSNSSGPVPAPNNVPSKASGIGNVIPIAAGVGGAVAALALVCGLVYGYNRWKGSGPRRGTKSLHTWSDDTTVVNAYALRRVASPEAVDVSSPRGDL